MKEAKDTVKAAKRKTLPRGSKETTTEKGHAFEKKVATWARRKFNLDDVKQNQFFKGKVVARPYQVDIVGLKKVAGVLEARIEVFWIECKARKETVKRTDIAKFHGAAIDVKKMVPAITWSGLSEEQVKMRWDHLIFVSTSPFDGDAIKVAKQHKIACYYYDGKTFQEQK